MYMIITAACQAGTAVPVFAGPGADEVYATNFAPGASYGHAALPDIVLGYPGGTWDVASLGDGGSITLKFSKGRIIDGPGVDFTIFENSFYIAGGPEIFAETARVEAGKDGVNYYAFEMEYTPAASPEERWRGMAGVMPVLALPDTGIDPSDPSVSGGDSFDLLDIGLDWACYIRLTDTGKPGTSSEKLDRNGTPIDDPGNYFSGYNAGFDLDAVVAVNYEAFGGTPTPEPTVTPTPTPTPDVQAEIRLNAPLFAPGRTMTADFALYETIRLPFSVYSVFILPDGSMIDAVTLGPVEPFVTFMPGLAAPFNYRLVSVAIPAGAPRGEYEIVAAFFDLCGPITGRGSAFLDVSARFTIKE